MLNRLTVSSLIKSVIVLMATCMTAMLCLTAWNSWERLTMTSRISVVAGASSNLFKAMHNLRSDRSTTSRNLNEEATLQPDVQKYLRSHRDAELAATRSAAEALASIEFADQKTLVPELNRLIQTFTALEAESWDAMSKPKASRRPALGKEYVENTAALLEILEKLSTRIAAAVNHNDPVIDQLLMIKQLAWLMRNTAGEASLLISNGLSSGRVAPDLRQTYTKLVGGIETAWAALQTAAAGSELPRSLVEAMAGAKTAYFAPDFLALRDRLMNALETGGKAEMKGNEWSPFSVEHMSSAVTVAERALDTAKDYALAQHAEAERSLVLQLVLLAASLALAFGTMTAVSRRVIRPLHTMRDAMLKVAAGDLTVDTGYAQRSDEIGALAGALETFKQQAADKLRIEQQERERHTGAAARQRAVEGYVGEFESLVHQTLDQLNDASGQMRTTSAGLSAVSSQTNSRVKVAEKASGEASLSVESVASASEELSASIEDISRQASHAAGIAKRAVTRARETDDTVQGLAKTAGRIGEVVGLINSIAAQTNLLALNATIEAARAGEAGRGFAVVASEVKSLASQTAKATDDISEQITDIQKVASDAIDAIKAIGGIIGEVNEVATAIAAAVEEQGAATQEITRSTQHAAQGTRNVSENITGVKTDADAAAAAAEKVKQASETLETQSLQLSSQVTEFLGKIRAA
ncbi:MAG: methyl-accepting chemotaxis protein [Bradyrhizobium sp.]|jgi:methyl-accepting chemotaxis protein|uniref:methyl-accepting chemotaxis protein n=1 Tax=Bradyrhizobium sp. TaxID=376 RepID=UPI0012041F67|nr:HAMP domain-containing methyl-accepting chemotaxis protein [Bradyrhizobium sp.]THD46471.1 MAG: methyl-accepting chemotaxis protein [Bradyrhizobium sp.]